MLSFTEFLWHGAIMELFPGAPESHPMTSLPLRPVK